MQLGALVLEEVPWIGCCFDCVSQIRQPKQPQRMFHLVSASNSERNPTRVWNPVMLFRQTLVEECVPDRQRKGYIHDPTRMNVPDLGVSKAELTAPKSMPVKGNFRP